MTEGGVGDDGEEIGYGAGEVDGNMKRSGTGGKSMAFSPVCF